jgi:hypothetical protein
MHYGQWTFSNGHPWMPVPGQGEIMCRTYLAGEANSTLRFDADDGYYYSFNVYGGQKLYLWIGSGDGTTGGHWTVETGDPTAFASVLRQPQIDEAASCDGSQSLSSYEPWTVSGSPIHLTGIMINNGSDFGCVSIMNTAGQTRWSYCDNMNQRGFWALPNHDVFVDVGENVYAQWYRQPCGNVAGYIIYH